VNQADEVIAERGEELVPRADDMAPLQGWRGVASRVFGAIRRGAEPNANAGNRLLTAGILLILACVFFVPTAFYVVPGFGSEDSWHLTINKALTEGWGFGDRIIWTYGPFGFF
jgi:hypothetical protein